MNRFLLAVAFALAFIGVADAQIAAVPITTAGGNWWQQVINIIIENGVKPLMTALSITIAGLIVAVIVKWLKKLGIEITQAEQNQLQDASQKALQWAIMQAIDLIKTKGWSDPMVRGQVIRDATNYMKLKFPDVVERVKVSAGTDSETALHPVLTRLVPQAFAQAAASPATPSALDKDAVPVNIVSDASGTR